MAEPFLRGPRPAAAVGGVLALLVLSSLPGCGKGDGLSDYERMKKKEEQAANGLHGAGVKTTQVRYPQGEAWSVNMSGVQITDELLDRVKSLGRVAELDLSKSTITDDQLARVNEVEIGSLLVKLDLSHTAVTDAGLDRLTNLLMLANLNLAGTKVTPAGVERFKKKRQEDPKIKIKNTNIRLK